MKKVHFSLVVPALAGLLIVALPSEGEAQHRRYYRASPPSHVPNQAHRPRHRYKHRFTGYLGAQLMALAVVKQQLNDIDTIGHGGGVGITGGIRLGKVVSLEANWTFTAHDEYWRDEIKPDEIAVEVDSLQIQTFTADLKLHIPTFRRVEPYFQLGGGWAILGGMGWKPDEPKYEKFMPSYVYTDGPTFNAGMGLNVWLGRFLTIGGRVLYRGIYFTEADHNMPRTDGSFYGTPENFIHGVSAEVTAAFNF